MRDFDFIVSPAKLLTPEIVQMVSSIHEHKGKQELFLEANVDELKTLLEVALIQSTGASNRIEGIFTSDKRLEELVSQKAEPRNRLILPFPSLKGWMHRKSRMNIGIKTSLSMRSASHASRKRAQSSSIASAV